MYTTQRIRRSALFGEPLRSLPIVLTSLFIVMAAVDVLLVVQPSPLHALRDDWQRWVKGSVDAPWATLIGAGAIVACVAFASAMVSVIVRAIAEAPYRWLASALVAGCCFAVGSMVVDLPLRLPTPWFAGMSALLLLGGGALFQSRSVLVNTGALFITTAPLALLGLGYLRAQTSAGAPYPIDQRAQLLLGILSIATVGTPLIALAARRLRALGGGLAVGEQAAHRMVELIERAHSSERRANEAERRLLQAQRAARATPRLLDEDEVALTRGTKSSHIGTWSLLTFVVVGAAVAYVAGYRPIQNQLATQRKLNHELTQKHATALAKLRTDFDRERQALQQGASAAEPAQPPSEPAAAAEEAPIKLAPAAAHPSSTRKSARTTDAAASRPSHRPPAPPHPDAAGKATRAAPPVPGRVAAPEDGTRTLQSSSDDPIEGLDGL